MEDNKNNGNDSDDMLNRLGIAFLVILSIGVLAEAGMLIYGYTHADKVSCNFLWCTFTSSKGTEVISRTCSMNGQPINCSEIDTKFPDFANSYD